MEAVAGGVNTYSEVIEYGDPSTKAAYEQFYSASGTGDNHAIKGDENPTLSGIIQQPMNGNVNAGTGNMREAPVYTYGENVDGTVNYGGTVRGVDGTTYSVHNKGANQVHNSRSSGHFYRDQRYPGFMMLEDCPHANAASASYEPSSRGKGMQYYIHYTDSDIKTTEEGSDQKHWYFKAPTKFLGHQGIMYGGKLKFTLSASTGDFSAKNLNTHKDLVVIECRTCDTNKGIRLVYQMEKNHVHFDGKTTSFEVPFKESSWLMDPKNVLLDWSTPSDCILIEVLSHLSNLYILGDHTRWFETVSIDDVSLEVANSSTELPITKCYEEYTCRKGRDDCKCG
jgi:hypothetical protein